MLSTKPPRCKFCKNRTEKIGKVLHDLCIDPWLEDRRAKEILARQKKERAEAKVEKAKDKARLRELSPKRVKTLKAAAQDSFNQFVRLRDAEQPCISCGTTNPPMKPGGAWDAGHFKSRGAYPELAFNEDNCHKQCKSCNAGSGKFAHKARTVAQNYETRLIERIGLERVEALKVPHPIIKRTDDDWRALSALYKQKLRELKGKE